MRASVFENSSNEHLRLGKSRAVPVPPDASDLLLDKRCARHILPQILSEEDFDNPRLLFDVTRVVRPPCAHPVPEEQQPDRRSPRSAAWSRQQTGSLRWTDIDVILASIAGDLKPPKTHLDHLASPPGDGCAFGSRDESHASRLARKYRFPLDCVNLMGLTGHFALNASTDSQCIRPPDRDTAVKAPFVGPP